MPENKKNALIRFALTFLKANMIDPDVEEMVRVATSSTESPKSITKELDQILKELPL
jgi:hypothetical protein